MCPFLMSAALDLSAMTSGLTPGTEEALFVLFLLPPAAQVVPPPDFTKKLSTLARGSRPAVTEAVDSLPRTPPLMSGIRHVVSMWLLITNHWLDNRGNHAILILDKKFNFFVVGAYRSYLELESLKFKLVERFWTRQKGLQNNWLPEFKLQ